MQGIPGLDFPTSLYPVLLEIERVLITLAAIVAALAASAAAFVAWLGYRQTVKVHTAVSSLVTDLATVITTTGAGTLFTVRRQLLTLT